MTTAATASIISIFVLATSFHKTSDKTNHPSLFGKQHEQTTLIPELSLATDTPKTEKTNSTVTVTNGNNVSITSIKTGKGTTNISITNTGDSVITKISSPGKDSTYAYAYSNHSGNTDASVFIFNDGNTIVASSPDNISYNLGNLSEDMDKMTEELENVSVKIDGDNIVELNNSIGKGSCKGKGNSMSYSSSSSCSGNGMSHSCSSSCSGNTDSEDSLISKIEDALINDKLISDRKVYSFSIDGKSVKVNGKKLDNAAWEKYKTIIETNSHSTVNHKFEFSLSKAGDNITINMKNFDN
jgi:hypothetical protein